MKQRERKEQTLTRKLIIDGNAVYEIDEECMLKNRIKNNGYVEEKKEANHEYREKNRPEHPSSQGRIR